MLSSVCLFCGANAGGDPRYAAAARATGEQLARLGVRVVFGGGRVGLMGAVADGALAEGGDVIGVIPRTLVDREIAHDGVDLRIVPGMHERKALMADLADGFVALPGGIGTLEELFEVWTWGSLGLHDKALGLLDVDGFWRPLEAFLDHATAAGFVRPQVRARLHRDDDLERLLARLGDRQAHRGLRPPPA